jgi:hypothetical protein
MDDKERLLILEKALAQMLKPIKGIPFSVIVQALAEHAVIQVDRTSPLDIELLECLERAIKLCAAELTSKPIMRPRPNEVGNDVEAYVMRALPQAGLNAARPTSKAGIGKSTGYPEHNFLRPRKPTYLFGMQDIRTWIGSDNYAVVLSISVRFIQSRHGRASFASGVRYGKQGDR